MAREPLGNVVLQVDGEMHHIPTVNVYNALTELYRTQQIPSALLIGGALRAFYGDISYPEEEIGALHQFAREHPKQIIDALRTLSSQPRPVLNL